VKAVYPTIDIRPVKGSYVLLIELPEERTITAGSLKDIRFQSGCYAYVGSALGGLRSRLSRHLRRNKKLHWHIDYLLRWASISDIIICETEERIECIIARILSRRFNSIPGFGSSDCKCASHLLFTGNGMVQDIIVMLKSAGMKPVLVKDITCVA
jgi:Uri superfamily endonuclease